MMTIQERAIGIPEHYKAYLEKHPRQYPALPPNDDPTSEALDKLLAQELNNLSIKERDTILEDVHGVAAPVEETPELLRKSFLELDREVDKITGKSKLAYLEAMQEDPSYVTSGAMLLKFLRAHRFSPRDAAVCMVSFYDIKLELFGPQRLTREIVLSDLGEQDMDYMRRGGFQLSGRDRSGRAIISQWPKILNEKDFPIECKLRGMYYIMMAAVESETVQKKGIVGLVYNVGSRPHIDRVGIWHGSRVLKAMPVRTTALHYCYNNQVLKPLISFGMTVVGEEIRARVRPHFGSDIECIYKLQTFGIPEENLPISSVNSEMNINKHLKWVEYRQKMEAAASALGLPNPIKSSDDNVMINNCGKGMFEPAETDVLFGRGKAYQNHPGNVKCRELVDSHLPRYEIATKREKTSLANELLQIIKMKPGRFLKFENNFWVEVDDAVARDKISHMFRSRRRKHPDEDEEDEELLWKKSLLGDDELGFSEDLTRRAKKMRKVI